MEENTKAVASSNPCIQVFTTTTKKVVKGTISGFEDGGKCHVLPWNLDSVHAAFGVELHIYHQTFSKFDLKHLINKLTEIHEVL